MRLTAEQLETRRPVWIALADLFLDTDVRLNYASTALTLADSPFSESEIEDICRDEVAQVVESNLLSVAGEWAGFDNKWLIERIVDRMNSRWHLHHFSISGAKTDIQAVMFLMGCLRRLPPERRHARWSAWNGLCDLFLNRGASPNMARFGNLAELEVTVAELDEIFHREMMPSFGQSIELYAKDNRHLYPDRSEVLANFAEWRSKLSEK